MTNPSEEQPVYGPHLEDSRYVPETMAFSAEFSVTPAGEEVAIKGFVADADSGLFVPSVVNVYDLTVNHTSVTHFDMFNDSKDMDKALEGLPYATVFDVSTLGLAAHAAGTRADMVRFLKYQFGVRGASDEFRDQIAQQADGMMQMRLYDECGEGEPTNLQEIFGDIGTIAISENEIPDDADQETIEADFGFGVYL